MASEGIFYRSLTEIADLLRRRELSPVELTKQMLERIALHDATLNSFLTVTSERAMERARLAESELVSGKYRGPLHGVPIAVKDLYATRGIRTSCASRVLWDWKPDFDATAVQRLEAAGAVLLGKLNMTEFAMSGYHPTLPIPRNPWDHSRSTGGSSSGSAVATAAGLCFASLGSDTGGSIRAPSSWCNVVGLKPTFGRVSRFGVFPLGTSLDHVGPMTRTVADATAVLSVIAGHDPNDPTTLRAPVPDYRKSLGDGVRGLRIGFDESFTESGALPEMVESVAAAGQCFEQLGAKLVRVELPNVDNASRAWSPICSSEAAAAHAPYYPTRADEYGRSFRSFLGLGKKTAATEYAQAHVWRLEFAGRLAGLFEEVDVFLCPGNFGPAPPAEAMPPDMEFSPDFWPFMRYTAPFNMSGSPTLSLPAGFTGDGLPLGVQLVGRLLDEAMLCRVGHAYERANDWYTRHPRL